MAEVDKRQDNDIEKKYSKEDQDGNKGFYKHIEMVGNILNKSD